MREYEVEVGALINLAKNYKKCGQAITAQNRLNASKIERELDSVLKKYSEYQNVVSKAYNLRSQMRELNQAIKVFEKQTDKVSKGLNQGVVFYTQAEKEASRLISTDRVGISSFGLQPVTSRAYAMSDIKEMTATESSKDLETTQEEKIEETGLSDAQKNAIKYGGYGIADATLVNGVIGKLSETSHYTGTIAKFGPGFQVSGIKVKPGVKALKGAAKIAGPVTVGVYGYSIYDDIKTYDGEEAVKAVTTTTIGTAVSVGAGVAIGAAGAAIGAPVIAITAAVVVAGVGISMATDWIKDKWINGW